MKRSFFNLPLVTDVDAIPVGGYTAQMIKVGKQGHVISLVERALPQLSTTTAGTFKDRYVLGSGFPHVPIGEDSFLVLYETKYLIPADLVGLDWPPELDLNALPRYRIVLERIECFAS